MSTDLTIEEALDRGQITVNAPPILIILSVTFVSFFGDVIVGCDFWLFGICTVLGVLIAWRLWCSRLAQWRVWAFSNIRNVHELQKRAEQRGILWRKGSFMHAIEYQPKMAPVVEQLKALEPKFEVRDTFIPDPNTPAETIIINSKEKNYWKIIVTLIFICLSVFMIRSEDGNVVMILGVFMIIVSVYSLILAIRNSADRRAKIKLSAKGIWTAGSGYFSWADIQDEETITERLGGQTFINYLIFRHSKGKEKISINELNIDCERLDKLLIYYRLEWESGIVSHR